MFAEVARAVAGRDVHASGKRHGEMGEIPADAAAFLVALRRGAVPSGMVVAEFNAVVGVVADRLRSLPSAPDASEERPGEVRKLLGVAVATCQQEGEDVTRQRRNVPLRRGRANLIRQAAILDDELAADFEQSRRCDEAGTDVAIRIEVVPRVHGGRKLHRLIAENVPVSRGMGGQHEHHGNRVWTLKGDVVTCPNFHKNLLILLRGESANSEVRSEVK
jgi:hypothetical protein